MTTIDRQTIQRLHALYCQLTELRIPLDMYRERIWFEWMRRGLDEQALRDVVAHIRRGIREQRRNPGALKFSNLIGNPDFFEEDLAEARAVAHGRKSEARGQKAEVLRATGRSTVVKDTPARSAGDVMAGDQAFAQFRKLKEEL